MCQWMQFQWRLQHTSVRRIHIFVRLTGDIRPVTKGASGSGRGAVSENIRRQFRQFGTLAFLQFDVRGDGLVSEPADDVIEAV